MLGSLLVSLSAMALPLTQPKLVPAPVQRIYLPEGFDDNDNVQVIVKGQFVNSCYKTGPATATVDTTTSTITVDPQAYLYAGDTLCAQIVIPYILPVSIGPVPKGTYKVVVKGQPQVQPASLGIAKALQSTPDDYLYLPVDGAGLVDRSTSEDTLRLEGQYPMLYTGCMEMKEIRTKLTSDNVLVVQPIAEVRPDGSCTHKPGATFAFEKSLGQKLAVGQYVVHVRTLNGNALNRYFEVLSEP